MTPAEIATALVRHGTRIAVEGERVRLVFNGNAPPDDLVQAAREAKAALRKMVRPTPAFATNTEDHRAAVTGYDCSAPRQWSDAVARLDPNNPPSDVPPRRWLRFINDCRQFLDDGWAAKATALGWDAADLFGCDRHRPWARIDCAGLLWLMAGRRLVALTADSATIETASGGWQTYRRVPNRPGQVLAWSLCGGGDR